jgi:hypothetical protein
MNAAACAKNNMRKNERNAAALNMTYDEYMDFKTATKKAEKEAAKEAKKAERVAKKAEREAAKKAEREAAKEAKKAAKRQDKIDERDENFAVKLAMEWSLLEHKRVLLLQQQNL